MTVEAQRSDVYCIPHVWGWVCKGDHMIFSFVVGVPHSGAL